MAGKTARAVCMPSRTQTECRRVPQAGLLCLVVGFAVLSNGSAIPYHDIVPEPAPIFDRHIAFDPAGDLEAFLKLVPARWVVYLMADGDDRPVQLLCVKNLRASLKRRLGGEEPAGPTRKVDYRQLVRRVCWRAVDSALEADLVYLEAARRVFPESYRGMVGFRPAWFVHVDPEAAFPRFTKTTELRETRIRVVARRSEPGVDVCRAAGAPTGGTSQVLSAGGGTGGTVGAMFIGPVEDKHAAARLIELAESVFDLCRYYNILAEAPRGKACAYKEMGRCPAPCDGSIPMDRYRAMVREAAEAIVDPKRFVAGQTQRMQQAAAALQFEQAGKLKAAIDQASQFGKGPFRHARRLEDFIFISLQRGPKEGRAKVMLITPARVEEVLGLIDEPAEPAGLLRLIQARVEELRAESLTQEGVERIGLISQHLFTSRQTHGVFLRLDEADEKALVKGCRDLRKQKAPEESETEGIVKELQAL